MGDEEIPPREKDVYRGLREQQQRMSNLRKKVDELGIDQPTIEKLKKMIEELEAENKRLIERLNEGRVLWARVKKRPGPYEDLDRLGNLLWWIGPPETGGEEKNPVKG